jgi:hypothetical protein
VKEDTEGWGDQGDGTYRNPVLNVDFSDPDVIRVGNKYYIEALQEYAHAEGGGLLEREYHAAYGVWRLLCRSFLLFDNFTQKVLQ